MTDLTSVWRQVWQGQRRWLLFRVLCAVVWAGELFWVQALAFGASPYIRYPLVVQSARFYLDLVLTLTVVLLLRKRYLVPLLVAQAAALLVMAAYGDNFHRPFMPARTFHELNEAWSMRGNLAAFLLRPAGILLLVTFALKFAALLSSGDFILPWRVRLRSLAGALAIYMAPVFLLQLTHLRLSARPNGGMERAVFAYGYTLPWICDAFANRSLHGHSLAARPGMQRRFDRISPVEPPLDIPSHLVVLQLESVDDNSIEASVEGAFIMPFLRDLKSRSMFFRIQAFHATGSCDMDYAATTFMAPYPNMVPYLLPDIPYTDSMPAFLKGHGFTTYFYHGNSSLFYSRGRVIEQLGFDHVFFKEQLAGRKLSSSVIGIRDADILNCALQEIVSEKRAYVFLITLDTHFPFTQLAPHEHEVFPQPQDEFQRYLDSLRYVDNRLRDFIRGLPEGSTVVIYGDHTTSMRSATFTSDVQDGKEYVGCVIYQKGSDLSARQQTRHQPLATDGSLNLLDVMSFLRHSLEVGRGPAGGSAQGTTESLSKTRPNAGGE